MTTSKKKKSSTNIHISRPYALRARTVRFHRIDNRTGSSTTHSTIAAASLETLGMLRSEHPESDNPFSEYNEDQTDLQHDDQTDIQHDDPAEANTDGKEKSKRRKRAKAMEDWLMYRDTYLQELLRHDGRQGLQVTYCVNCGDIGDFSCYDCAYCMHYCKDCLVDCHRLMPLHRIRVRKLILSVIWHLKRFSIGQVFFTKRLRYRSWV